MRRDNGNKQHLSDRGATTGWGSQPVIDRRTSRGAIGLLCLSATLGINLVSFPIAQAQVRAITSIGNSVAFSCNDSEATIKAKNGAKVTVGTTTIYIGYQQVSSTNKNPRLIRFDNGRQTWCRTDYETTGDDGSGYGLMWDGRDNFYGVFSSTGTQTGNDFRRFATNGWLKSYGNGGGAKVAVLAKINPTNGDVLSATFISAHNPSTGKTNSLVVTGLVWQGTSINVLAKSWWLPRRTNTTAMTCSGGSPFAYDLTLTTNLTTALVAKATGCS